MKRASKRNAARDTLREVYRKRLMAEAARRFGKRRARALAPNIVKLAGDLAAVHLFPVDADARPQYFALDRE